MIVMTDPELIRLVQEVPPEELSLEQIELLRSRLSDSNELREAVAHHLRLEQVLSQSLGRVEVSVDAIIQTANLVASGTTSLARLLGWGLAILIGVSLVTTFVTIAVKRNLELQNP